MKIAIDLDGTAWAHRELFRCMINGFIAAGHQVGILTGHNVKSAVADLHLWKARGFPTVHFYIAKETEEAGIPAEIWKPSMMKKHQIDYLFDDLDTNDVRLLCGKPTSQETRPAC